MKATLNTFKGRDDYLELVRRFPLRKMRDPAEHTAALDMLRRLGGQDDPLSDGQAEYFDALAALAAEYERRTLPPPEKMTPIDVLKHLVEAGGLTVNDVGRIIGSQSSASMILNGRRGISKTQARPLADHFGLDAGVFIE